MQEKDLKNLKKLEKMANLMDFPAEATFLQLDELEDRIEKLEEIKPLDGYTPQKGVDYFDGEPGTPGKDYVLTSKDKKEIANQIEVPVIEKIIEKTEVIKEQPIYHETIKEVAIADEKQIIEKVEQDLPQLGEPIRDSLELLTGNERLDRKSIKGLDDYDEISELARKPKASFGGGLSRGVADSLYAPISSTNHANLSNLDYSSSGHIGFQQGITFSTTAPTDPYLYQLWVQIP